MRSLPSSYQTTVNAKSYCTHSSLDNLNSVNIFAESEWHVCCGVVHVVVCSSSGESGMEGARRSSMDNPYAVQLRRKSYVGPDPRERTPTRNPRPDLRRMSLYLEPGTWRTGLDHGLVPTAPSRRVTLGPDSFTPPYRMTDSLTEIQGDIQRLSHQQQQIQSLMHNGMNSPANQAMQQPPGHFYLHDQVDLIV